MVANVRKRTASGEVSFLADCPSLLAVEDLVYITGPEVLGTAQVDIVDVTDINTFPAIGIVIEKITSTRARILTVGEVTTTATLTPGKRYFAGAAGTLVLVMPTPGVGQITFSQPMGYALATNKFIFNPELFPIIQKG